MPQFATLEPPVQQHTQFTDTAGDGQILGVDMKTPRDQLRPGYVARAENARFDRGIRQRKGTRTPVFAQPFQASVFLGSGSYSNPNGSELGLLAASGGVVAIRAGTIPISIPASETLAGAVEFSQQFDKVLLHRDDPTKSTLIWDGDTDSLGFVPVVSSIPDGASIGILQIPNAPWSINALGRAWMPVPGTTDSFLATDLSDYTTYDSILHVFRVNSGTSDSLVGLFPIGQHIIVGKRRSIDALERIPQDLGDAYLTSLDFGLSPSSPPPPSPTTVSSSIGMVSRKAVIQTGTGFMFLSDSGKGGIYQIQLGNNSESIFSVNPFPISDKIEPLIRRINWSYAGGATAKMDGIFAIFSVPLDGCTYNNANLVYNTATQEWQGVDFWRSTLQPGRGRRQPIDNPMRMDNLLTLDYYGVSRLFAVDHAAGATRLLYEGLDDQLSEATGVDPREAFTYPIQYLIESRGFASAETNRTFDNLNIAVLTSGPSITITQIVDGQNDERVLTTLPIGRDHSSYYIWRKPFFFVNNQNDDFLAPKRQGYFIFVSDGIKLWDGIPLAQLSPETLQFSTEASGRFCSYRIQNTQGYISVLAILEESEVDSTQYERLLR